MLGVGGVMAVRQVHVHRASGDRSGDPDSGVRHATRHLLDDPIITFSPAFVCKCPRALKVLITATIVGLLTVVPPKSWRVPYAASRLRAAFS